jgi:hypothetical protein
MVSGKALIIKFTLGNGKKTRRMAMGFISTEIVSFTIKEDGNKI